MVTLTPDHKRNLVVAVGILIFSFVFLRYGNTTSTGARTRASQYVAGADEVKRDRAPISTLFGAPQTQIQMAVTGDRQQVTFKNTREYSQELLQRQATERAVHEETLAYKKRYNPPTIGFGPQIVKTKSVKRTGLPF